MIIEPPTDPQDPLERLTQRHEAIVLDEELAELPEHYRAAIVMHWYENCPLQLLADHFGTTVGSIRGRLQRGKQLLAQRLRLRGVVPVAAFAASQAWTVSPSQAATFADSFIDVTSSGESLPDSPIDPPVVDALLFQGIRLMPSLYSAIGITASAAILGALVLSDAGHTQGQGSGRVVALSGDTNGTTFIDQPAADVVLESQSGTELTGAVPTASDPSASASDMNMMMGDDMGMGMSSGMMPGPGDGMMMGMGGGASAGMGAMGAGMTGAGMTGAGMTGAGNPAGAGWAFKPSVPVPSSAIAQAVLAKLDAATAPALSTSLAEFPAAIRGSLQIPVTMDQRGLQFAKQSGTTPVKLSGDLPLRTALHQALQPLGLKAIVADEGLVITADPAALVHQGVGVNRWISVDEDAEKKIAEKLDASINVQMDQVPLAEVVEYLNREGGLPTSLDQRSLEEIGLSPDEPVSLTPNGGSLRNALSQLLRSSDLTYTVRDDMLVITTKEAAEQDLITRIYWLEGTGTAAADYLALIETLQSSIVPDGWDRMGGPFTMSRLNSTRPALVVGATYTVHHQLERFFKAMRETHFGGEPVLEQIQVPMPNMMYGGGMGGGGGGMGGMGGGGGMF
jgi:hypothetical protein